MSFPVKIATDYCTNLPAEKLKVATQNEQNDVWLVVNNRPKPGVDGFQLQPFKSANADLGNSKLSFNGFTFPHLHHIFGSSPQLSIGLCLEKTTAANPSADGSRFSAAGSPVVTARCGTRHNAAPLFLWLNGRQPVLARL